jgi:hypothetical protein
VEPEGSLTFPKSPDYDVIRSKHILELLFPSQMQLSHLYSSLYVSVVYGHHQVSFGLLKLLHCVSKSLVACEHCIS